MTTLLYDLPRLVDLSLGTCESATVNFSVLRALLHAIVKILNTDNIRVDLTELSVFHPESALAEDRSTISVKEYEVESEGKKKALIIRRPREVDKILVVRKGKIGDEIHEDNIPTKIVESKDYSKAEPDVHRKVEPEVQSEGQSQVHSKVEPGVQSKVKPGSQSKVEAQVYSIVETQVHSEPEAQVHSKVQDGPISHAEPVGVPKRRSSKTNSKLDLKITNIEEKIKKMESNIKDIYSKLSKTSLIPSGTQLEERISKSKIPKHSVEKAGDEQIVSETIHTDNDQTAAIIIDINDLKNEISNIKGSINNITNNITAIEIAETKRQKRETTEEPKEIEQLLTCSKLEETINLKIEDLKTKFVSLTDEVLDIERNLTTLSYQVEEFTRPKGKSDVSIGDILKEMMIIKGKIQTVMSETSFLMTERERMKTNVDTMTIAIDDVQRNKVDRDEIDELLAEKADYNMLQRKVSIDEFDANKRDYNYNLTATITAIDARHENLYTEFKSFKSFLDTKVNQDEIKDMRTNLERRIQTLNGKLEVLLNQKDPEAAGTKIKVLKDINCVSCSQKVLMKTEEDNLPRKNAMPGHRSIKPFLTYELDSVRKQMKEVGTSRNLHHFESILKDGGLTTDPKARQIVNRYCGGSHTIITAQDRVDRGRCKKLHGAKSAAAKCICGDPKNKQPSEKPHVKSEQTTKSHKEADICACPSEEDPLEKCMSPQVKRSLEIDARRRMICKYEAEQNFEICKAIIDNKQKLLNEKGEKKLGGTCVIKQNGKSTSCEYELEKYNRCRELSKGYTRHDKEAEYKGSVQQMEDHEKEHVTSAERLETPQEKQSHDKVEHTVEEDLAEANKLEQPEKLNEDVLSEGDKSEYSARTAEETVAEISELENLEEPEQSEQPPVQLEEPEQPEQTKQSEQLIQQEEQEQLVQLDELV